MSDDLTDLIAPHWSAESGPRPGIAASAGLELGQGTVTAWEPLTPGGTAVRYRGIDLIDPPVFSSTDLLVIRPGDHVAVLSATPGGGSGAYFVLGRITIPGTGGVATSLDFLRTDLAKELASLIFAERVHAASNYTYGTRTSTSYGDLSSGVGPTVANVPISESGKAIAFISTQMYSDTGSSGSYSNYSSGYVSVAVTGATTVAASDNHAANMQMVKTILNQSHGYALFATPARTVVLTGLNPGLHTFTAKFRANPSSQIGLQCYATNLIVIGL